ncbi:DUF6483 family protein [Thermoguttaceae bacterium LCP21S3_D4]|nr:DUF6483 family protein [Lachnospiraceae bacterium]MDD6304159.1 DUF6483 family protein [Lachnospiraceae bacterium]
MYEQDYIMRLIKEMVRTLLKLLFNVDTDSPSAELLEEREDKQLLNDLLTMVDDGRIDEAENKIYEITENDDKNNLKIAVLFYANLNNKSDAFLEQHNFSRDEIKSGLWDVVEKYEGNDFADMFLE